MKNTVIISAFLVLILNSGCRFEANHEQIPAQNQQDVKDKTEVVEDTLTTNTVDSLPR